MNATNVTNATNESNSFWTKTKDGWSAEASSLLDIPVLPGGRPFNIAEFDPLIDDDDDSIIEWTMTLPTGEKLVIYND